MSEVHSTSPTHQSKPAKPSPDFPLFAHATRRWAKKIKGKLHYFGRWEDPDGALREFLDFAAGKPREKRGRQASSLRPAKPYPEYPLYAHAAGVWAKKIRGVTHYFGPWEDPDGALESYLAQKDALHAGRKPRPDADALTVKDLVNQFLNEKRARVETGELSQRTWNGYKEAADELVTTFDRQRIVADLGPDDFADLRKKLAKRWGPVRLGNVIQTIRSVFKFAYESDLLSRPMRFGPTFKKPSKKTLRVHRAKQGAKLFSAEEIRRLIDTAGVPMKAMILLGINCGFGNADCGNLPLAALDLDTGWIVYPRPKTGINRRCPLWPETIEALREALAKRREPKDPADAGLVFVTQRGLSWTKDIADSPVTKETKKLLNALGINGHRNFYTLRHTFRTVADEAKDQPSADFIMGHESTHMSSVYRERISDERLKAVSDYVRAWLFQVGKTTGEVVE
jgi:integrase